MKIAIPVCAEAIASTADFARELVVADCEGSREVHWARFDLQETLPANRAKRIARLGVEILICGAISRPLATLLQESGVQVVPLVSGSVDNVLSAFLTDRLDEPRFLLPGCTPDDRRGLFCSRARLATKDSPHVADRRRGDQG
jgi:predicted Fe-Mo cluster-binding NifX family protein